MRKLENVRLAMEHPEKLNFEGKVNLVREIADEMTEEELDLFLKEWGYERK
jgi:hypothetical protein